MPKNANSQNFVRVCLHGNAFNATLMVNLSASIHCTNFLPSQFTYMRSIITDILWDCMLYALLDLVYSQTFFACGVENRKMAPLPAGLYPLCQLYFWHYSIHTSRHHTYQMKIIRIHSKLSTNSIILTHSEILFYMLYSRTLYFRTD